MDVFEINFKMIYPNVMRFEIYDGGTGIVYSDTVKLMEWGGSTDYRVREALNAYSFWMDLKMLIGDRRPRLISNRSDIVRQLFNANNNCFALRKDPWLFS